MKFTHPDIANKEIDCFFLHIPEHFERFAHACGVDPEQLFPSMKEAISTRHHESTPSTMSEHPHGVRYLEMGAVGIYYQVLPDIVEIGALVSVDEHMPYGESSALSTDFSIKQTHEDIAGKRFTYIELDESFYLFAENECDYCVAEKLLEDLEATVATEHGRARPLHLADHPRTIWELDNEHITFRYQLLPGIVEVGPITSKKTGVCFEPTHDLLAEFTR